MKSELDKSNSDPYQGYIGCVCAYVGLTRQRDQGYIGCVCAHVGLTRQRDQGFTVCVCTYVHVIGLKRQRDQGYIGCVCAYRKCMCICTCYRTDNTKRSELHRMCVYML